MVIAILFEFGAVYTTYKKEKRTEKTSMIDRMADSDSEEEEKRS